MSAVQTYWEKRYLNGQTAWDLGHVSQPLKKYIDQLSNKEMRILIPGAGNAYEAMYLQECGFQNIHVLDIAPTPLQNLKSAIGTWDQVQLIQADFFEHCGVYDLILEQTFFCALEVRFRESYAKQMQQLLSKKGILAGVLFDFTEKRETPPYGGSREEYEQLFSPCFQIKHLERCYQSEPERAGKELFIELIKK